MGINIQCSECDLIKPCWPTGPVDLEKLAKSLDWFLVVWPGHGYSPFIFCSLECLSLWILREVDKQKNKMSLKRSADDATAKG